MKRLIIFLIRKRLGLKKKELFKFSNQSHNDVYYFTDVNIMKLETGDTTPSRVSLNWLLDDECKVVHITRRE
jgi:hypothetical protein